MNDYEIVQLTKDNYIELFNYLIEIDEIFPVPMSSRVNIPDHAHKLLDVGIAIVAMRPDNRIIGVLLGYANDQIEGRGYLATLGVSPGFRSFGVGAHLVNSFERICKEKKMKYVGLHAHCKNTRAIAFYKRNGYALSEDKNKPYAESVYLIKIL